MDKMRQKSNKDKPKKNVDKEKSPSFITDVKAIKENLKIKEILRTVKMNSSMRIKAPRGSKVMQNKDFNDNEDFEEVAIEDDCSSEPPSATNTNVIIADAPQDSTNEEPSGNNTNNEETDVDVVPIDTNVNNKTAEYAKLDVEAPTIHKSNSFSESSTIMSQINNESETSLSSSTLLAPSDLPQIKNRDRKLSLDQTMLSRREGLSQSELDLHSIGKSPLERKSSFFRKKMDSFFKNTTEIFKKQSYGSKSQTIHRRGSMSVSLQSLNEKTTYNGDCTVQTLNKNQETQGSVSSLQSSLTTGPSNSSLSRLGLAPDTEEDSLAGSQPVLTGSQPIGDISSNRVNSLNEIYMQESLMNSRAISMSSGLDAAHGNGRRKASRSNRVTWLASEGLTNYFRRQEEKIRDMQACYSYQDFSTIPEALYGPKLDSKGRRLSYQRAVSGEDPVKPMKYQDTLRRKPNIPEHHVANYEISKILAELARPYNPSLRSYTVNLSEEAFSYLIWIENPENLVKYLNVALNSTDEARQSAILELICTEADYIRYLVTSVQHVFINSAAVLQQRGFLTDVRTDDLFLNFPAVLSANLQFWQIVLCPMIKDAIERRAPFNTNLMYLAFQHFPRLLQPYEVFLTQQNKALDYLRSLSASNPDFVLYITWCHSQEICNRLQLLDIIAKPLQRLTKYNLIIDRIASYTVSDSKRAALITMSAISKNYLSDVNRIIRQREELERIDALARNIEAFEIEFKDEELDRLFRIHSMFNLQSPMLHCHRENRRTVVHEVDVRFKDNLKEMEARAFLLTDMLLICKKQGRGTLYPYKLIRPKYVLDNLLSFPKFGKNDELVSIAYVLIDEYETALQCFSIRQLETSKDTNPLHTIKAWEAKYREAKLAYDYAVWFARNPSLDLDGMQSIMDAAVKAGTMTTEEAAIDQQSRDRVATMMHKKNLNSEIFRPKGDWSNKGLRRPRIAQAFTRTSTEGTTGDSRLSSYQKSTSVTSHDDQEPGPSHLYRAGTSVEHVIPPQNPDDVPTSITVKVEGECEPETNDVAAARLTTQPSSHPFISTCVGSTCSNHNTLLIHPKSGVSALIHSLPDLTVEPLRPRQQSQELLQENRESATQHRQFLTPDHLATSHLPHCSKSLSPHSTLDKRSLSHQELRQDSHDPATGQHHLLKPDEYGNSHPPPSPTRASLQRGQAISNSCNPPLSKMGHVNSQSQLQSEAGPVTTQPSLDGPSTSLCNEADNNVGSRHTDEGDLSPTRKENNNE